MNTDRTQKLLEALRIILQAEKEGTMTPAEAMENIFDIINANHTPEPEPEPPMVAIPNDDIEIVKLQLQAIALRQMFNTGWRH